MGSLAARSGSQSTTGLETNFIAAPGASAAVCIRRTTTISVLFLALVAAVVSFGHMHELALRHGETPLNAMLIPLSVDGMVVASSLSVLIASRAGISVPWLPWTLLIIGKNCPGARRSHDTSTEPRWGTPRQELRLAGALTAPDPPDSRSAHTVG